MRDKFSAVYWSLINKFSPQLVNFIVTIVLSRYILPFDYGNLSIILAFISLLSLIVDFGFTDSLIKKQLNRSANQYYSIFWTQLSISIILFSIVYFSAYPISVYFNSKALIVPLRLSASILILKGLYSIPHLLLLKELDFKKLSIVSFSTSFLSGIIAVYYAFNDFGLFAIIYRLIIANVLTLIAFYLSVNWRPKLIFSFNHLKNLFSFSSKVFIMRLLNVSYESLFNFIMISSLGQVKMGYFNRADAFKKVASNSIDASIQMVTYSIFSMNTIKENKNDFIKIHRVILLTIIFIFTCLYGCAKEIILLTIGTQWVNTIPLLKAVSLIAALIPLYNYYLTFVKTAGNINYVLKHEIFTKIILLLSAFSIVILDNIQMTLIIISSLLFLSCFLLMRYITLNILAISLISYVRQIKNGLFLLSFNFLLVYLIDRLMLYSFLSLFAKIFLLAMSCIIFLKIYYKNDFNYYSKKILELLSLKVK